MDDGSSSFIAYPPGSLEAAPVQQVLEEHSRLFSSLAQNKNTRIAVLAPKNVFTTSFIQLAFQYRIPYIPIDTEQPEKRIRSLLEQIGPTEILVDTNLPLASLAGPHAEVIEHWENYQLVKTGFRPTVFFPSLACVLFTSGSTGIPKGVMISRKNIEVFMDWMISEFSINQDTRILSIAPLHFDLSLFDLFSVSQARARLFFPRTSLFMNPLALADFIFTHKINTLYATPSWYSLLIRFGKLYRYDFSFVDNLLIAGEPLQEALAHSLHHSFENATIANLYGPTETNVCTFHRLDFSHPLPVRQGIVSIGKPCPYASLKIQEDGILSVSGASVMKGYWPDESEADFHRTGDLVEYDPAEELYYFIARADRMIKRNGYRIEPGEIEVCLRSYEGVKQAVVVCFMKHENYILCAHLVSDSTDREALLLYCRQHLPAYMLPDEFIFHNSLPLNTNGKIDHTLLTHYGK